MRVAIITSRTETVRWFREDLVRDIAARGHDVYVLGDDDPARWEEYFAGLGARYRSYPVSWSGVNPARELATLQSLFGILSELRPDVVFTYQAKANVYGCIAASAAGVPRIYASVEGLGTLSERGSAKRRAVNAALVGLYRRALSHAEKVFFVNPDDVDFFEHRGLVRPGQVVMTNGVGVNTDKFYFSEVPSGRPNFLFMGRLVAAKGVREFVQAAEILKSEGVDAGFWILGSFSDSPDAIPPSEVLSWVRGGTVDYLGEVDDVRPYLAACTALVSPSYGEGVPKSGMEAMSMGRPIIASDISGFRILVEDGVNGILVPVRDVRTLAAGMHRLADNPALAKRMGAAARVRVERDFDVRIVNQEIIARIGM